MDEVDFYDEDLPVVKESSYTLLWQNRKLVLILSAVVVAQVAVSVLCFALANYTDRLGR